MEYRISETGGMTVVAFTGDLDLEYSAEARKVLLDQVSRGAGVVVDMAGVGLVDSSGVASLIEAFQSARKHGKPFTLAAVGDPVMRVFKLARLQAVFVIVPDVEAGIRKG